MWVRCKDWLPKYSPGQFQVIVAGKTLAKTFGKAPTDAWQWVDGGTLALPAGNVDVRLHDLDRLVGPLRCGGPRSAEVSRRPTTSSRWRQNVKSTAA